MNSLFNTLRNIFVPRALERHARRCISNCEKIKDVASQLNLTDLIELANLAQFIAICSLDISTMTRHILLPIRSWKRTLHARHLALALFELSDDMPQLLGKSVRAIIARCSCPEQYLHDLDVCRHNLSELMCKHTESLLDVRRITAAHRDHDAMVLLKTIDNVNVDKMMDLAHSTIYWCADTLGYLQRLTNECSETTMKMMANKGGQGTLHKVSGPLTPDVRRNT